MARTLSLAEIFQLGYYWECKVMLTAVKLDVFGALAEGARTAADVDRKSTRLNSSHIQKSRMPSSA